MKYFRSCPRIRTPAVAATFAVVLSGCVLSSTGAPRIVADTSAILTGVVKSSQDDTVTYWFKYGTTPDYGSTTTTQTAFVQKGGGTGGAVSELVDGLTAGTTYHYQLCSDAPDHLPPACGADHVVTTTTGHDSVHGQGTYTYHSTCDIGTCTYDDSFSIVAAVDPNSSAIEGDLTFEGFEPGTPATNGDHAYTGVGSIECLRVSGNIAVVGYNATITLDDGTSNAGEGELVMEDNGATGDRYLVSSWSPTSACPTPSASLFNSGTPHSGNFVIYDG
jgi:hypothetical protein